MIKKLLTYLCAAGALPLVCSAAEQKKISSDDILKVVEKTSQWHIQNPTDRTLNIRDWEIAPYYDGLIALSKTTGNPIYWSEVIRFGDSAGWSPYVRKFHADDHAVAHAWLDTYAADTSKKYRLDPTKKMLDEVINDAKNWGNKKPTRRFGGTPVNTYNWCDALYMSPPVFARMYKLTGDKKYIDYMTKEYKWCFETLFSNQDDLFYRDDSYIGKKTKSGKRVFWGRGNGWVMGSFPQILPILPKDDPNYKFYEDLFKRMSEKLLTLQLDDGMWGVSLIDPAEFDGGETSSTCFIAYAMAWGVNNGFLDKAKFAPALMKAWERLCEKCVLESGKLVYVQPVGEAPNKFSAETSNPYGVGAFALFGCEMAKMLGHKSTVSDADLLTAAESLLDTKTPRAVAILEPRRADDVAWENDLIAFRAYGPALKDSIENSGIDVWFKKVQYPVLKRIYKSYVQDRKDYHKDNGEGYDNFKVADTVGCGGSGIWVDGKLYKSDVYQKADMLWSPRNEVSFRLYYDYDVKGKKITEIKTVTIKLGDDFCTAVSQFKIGNKPAKDIEVAVGIFPQTKDCKIVRDTVSKDIVTSEKIDGKELKMTVRLGKENELLFFKKFQNKLGVEELIITKPDSFGKVFYTFGFTWK